jgi:hypothetical protein
MIDSLVSDQILNNHLHNRITKYICRDRVHYCITIIEEFYKPEFGFVYKKKIF